jgi:beta-carotene ketolase (CrtW type)
MTALSSRPAAPAHSWVGLAIALVIITAYLGSWYGVLRLDLATLPWGLILLAIACRTFCHTGLFITAHDAIHGTVFPQNQRINDGVGAIALFLYALFLYPVMREKHLQHHANPATADDPDYYSDAQRNPALWYGRFIWDYLQGPHRWIVLGGMTLLFHSLFWLGHVPLSNLLLLWVLPNVISSMQLFFIGIYLPHRDPPDGHQNQHRSTTLPLPVFWSWLACYHFGYHWEHHEYPHVPWYRLPAYHAQTPQG